MVNETTLAEMEERASLAADALGDPEVAARYAKRAAEVDVPELVRALRQLFADGGGGGDLGLMLRNSLKARILRETLTLDDASKRIATMADDVVIHSMTVSAVRGEGRVIVDFRLMVGDQPVMK